MTTPILNITELLQSQSNKEVTINDALRALENATQKYRTAVATAPTNLSTANFTGYFYFNFTGTPGAWVLNIPATERCFFIMNNTVHDCTLQVTGGAGNDILIEAGEGRLIYSNGTDVFEIGGGGGAGSVPSNVAVMIRGEGTDESLTFTYVYTRDVEIADNFAGSIGYVETPSTGSSAVITMKHNGVTFGTITFAASSNTGVFATSAAEETFAPGDRLTFECPANFFLAEGFSLNIEGTYL